MWNISFDGATSREGVGASVFGLLRGGVNQ
jgi:hypothetical protein